MIGLAGRPLSTAWVIFLGALVVRLVYLAQGDAVPAQDTPDYDEIAHNLINGQGFVSRDNWFGYEMRSWRAPFYPFFLAAVYALSGPSHLAVQLVQCLVGALTIVLLYQIACRGSRRMAVGVGLLGAVYGPLAQVSSQVMTETWFAFWVVCAVYFLHQALCAEASQRWHGLAGGVAIGMAALTRPVGILVWVAFAVTAIWSLRRRGLLLAAGVGLAATFVVSPWSVRNYAVHGALVPITTHGGFVLARSHAPVPDWRRADGWGIDRSSFERMPSEVARDRHWRAQGWAQIRSNPGLYLRRSGERFLRFWYFLRPQYNLWYMMVLPLFVAGMVKFAGKPQYRLIGVYIGLSVLLYTFVLYGSTRFRLPLEPFFLLFAGALVADITGTSRRRALILVVAVVLINISLYLLEEPLRAGIVSLLQRWGLK